MLGKVQESSGDKPWLHEIKNGKKVEIIWLLFWNLSCFVLCNKSETFLTFFFFFMSVNDNVRGWFLCEKLIQFISIIVVSFHNLISISLIWEKRNQNQIRAHHHALTSVGSWREEGLIEKANEHVNDSNSFLDSRI